MGIFDHFSVQEDLKSRQEAMLRSYGHSQSEYYGPYDDATQSRLRHALGLDGRALQAAQKVPVPPPEPNKVLLLLGEDE